MKNYIHSHEAVIEEVSPGIRRQILGYDTNLMLVRVQFAADAVSAAHSHPHQQVTYVEKGVFEVTIGDEKQLLRRGDCFILPSGIQHGARCLEEGVLIDTFSPAREDFLK
ncbi:MAG: Cupin domain protein [bacterium ADurb.Bin431]|nr:MAG: Cupin domain protein [bacterium ADurb.Bin431]HNY90577.1 cupin domain-containing protein [bacterium]HOH06170.1 cupin domain-containing protein [bacterium]